MDEKKTYATFEEYVNHIVDKIAAAEELAYIHGIEANTIILNENHAHVKEFFIRSKMGFIDSCRQVPPMILGKNLCLGPLPDGYDFALSRTNLPNPYDELDKLKELIAKYMKTDGDFMFMDISREENEEDFKKLLDIIGFKDESERDY